MRHQRLRYLLASMALSCLGVSSARAQRATQVVRYSIIAISQGNISSGDSNDGAPRKPSGGSIGVPRSQGKGNPRAGVPADELSADRAIASTVWETTYALVSNEQNKKLTVSVEDPLPGGVEVQAELAAPPGAFGSGVVKLGATGSDAVTQIGPGSTRPLSAQVTVTESEIAPTKRRDLRVTFTLISGA